MQAAAAQSWLVTLTEDGWYTLRNPEGLALTVAENSAANGTDLTLSDYQESEVQKFRIVPDESSEDLYSLRTAVSNEAGCMDVYNVSREAGANICQWEYWGGEGQNAAAEPHNLHAVREQTEDRTEYAEPAYKDNIRHITLNEIK